ncbi:murein biosynthesis integral membrane protein MurJ [Candidatus Azambacteria bacterium]|nr:murein biosynthesis integral membrane protein MurJ [Candidatus Azambacteria bacterium]MBI3685031.1 murein biosynthesis integral membrane protein MurJ [Candidatus Azambacteria bacterium]
MKLKYFLNTEFTIVASAAFTIGFFSFLSKLLGVVRNRIFAGEFGAGDVMDTYFAAFLIPDFVYNLFIVGMLSSVFIPVFAHYRRQSLQEAWHLTHIVLTVFVTAVACAALVAMAFAPELISLVAPGFSPEKQKSAVALMRVMFLSPVLLGISHVVGSILQAHKMFFSFALAPIMYNTGIIIGAVFFVKYFGVIGLAMGVVLGALLHLAIQLPPLFKIGFSFRPAFDTAHKGVRKIAWLSLPRIVGLAATQINFVVITAIASTVTPGSVAIFNFANDLQFVPIGIVAFSFASAVFPFLAVHAAAGDIKAFLGRLYGAVNQILFFVIPVSIFFILERAQIVRVILGYGQFSWEDTRLTAAALGAFAISVFAQSLVPLFSRAFFALENTKTPVFINVSSAMLNVVLSFFFLGLMREGGVFASAVGAAFRVSDVRGAEVLALPIAFSLSAIVNFAWLYIAFSRRVEQFDGSRIVSSLLKINLAACVMALAVYGALYSIAPHVNMQKFTGIFSQGMVAFFAGFLAYSAASYFLKIPEFFALREAVPLPARRLISRIPFIQINWEDKL